jgi:orotidine-5'-phosphate decarboxylase
MNDRVIIALDVERFDQACALVECLPAAVLFKVGLQAFLEFGPEIIARLHERGKKVFLDLKFKDIPNTVRGAVQSSFRFQPALLTIHLAGGRDMITAALDTARSHPGLTILGVTVLTSLSESDLHEIGIPSSPEQAVLTMVELGLSAGMQGFVCSPREIAPIRARFGHTPLLVTPGIRPAWSEKGDQKRAFTPRMAVDAGADYLVVGRPITAASDPAAAFARVVAEMAGRDQ